MLYKLSTLIAVIGCALLLVLIFLENFKGRSMPYIKPILWITIAFFLIRLILRAKKR